MDGLAIEEWGKYLENLKQDAAGARKYYRGIWNSNRLLIEGGSPLSH